LDVKQVGWGPRAPAAEGGQQNGGFTGFMILSERQRTSANDLLVPLAGLQELENASEVAAFLMEFPSEIPTDIPTPAD
jgi:hypothetical protein